MRKDLTQEAVFLCRQLVALAATPESLGLLALLLLQESRSLARVTDGGDLVPLAKQNRSLWDRDLIREGVQLIQTAILSGQLGPYALQAAIASVHALADSVKDTQSKEEAVEWVKELWACMGNGTLKMAQLAGTSQADLKMKSAS